MREQGTRALRCSCAAIAVSVLMIVASWTGPAMAQVSGNVGVVSNYLFRGVSQTDDEAAVQGGFDFAHESGFYAGTWLSNVDFGGKEDTEVDLYAGYGGAFGNSGVTWDAGVIYYLFPGGGDLDYAETYLGLGYGLLSAGVAYTLWGEVSGASGFDTGDFYYNVGLDLPFELEQFSFSAFAGYYDFDEDGNPAAGNELSYAHWGLGASRDLGEFGSLGITYEQTDGGSEDAVATDDDVQIWLGWTLEF
ncbi:MAG: TorF family putative porin [Wenzhouxiangellaceae bacterium]|nr:TorF family putative porin [Wenzhouxiangellaceae bacterium]